MIQCNCTYDDGRVVDVVKWYDPVGIRLISPAAVAIFDATVPHFTRVTDGDHSNIILIIPTFNYSYDGTYTCGRRIAGFADILGTPNAAVTLTIVGGLMINTV